MHKILSSIIDFLYLFFFFTIKTFEIPMKVMYNEVMGTLIPLVHFVHVLVTISAVITYIYLCCLLIIKMMYGVRFIVKMM
jgi:hypothetical protein